ncbi:NADH:ubiquinone oxidoreductase 6.6kD subunit [Xylariaceae sp. FL1019]|nr:NADH:ubiquinone oxidoreductase 6.6kD subunit [Xylariaceae sp. FL1019]
MAGLQHYRLALDPAIQKLGTMQTNRHKYFRWTKRTAGITLVYTVIIPTIVGVLAYQTDGRWDMRGKRRGDMISEY